MTVERKEMPRGVRYWTMAKKHDSEQSEGEESFPTAGEFERAFACILLILAGISLLAWYWDYYGRDLFYLVGFYLTPRVGLVLLLCIWLVSSVRHVTWLKPPIFGRLFTIVLLIELVNISLTLSTARMKEKCLAGYDQVTVGMTQRQVENLMGTPTHVYVLQFGYQQYSYSRIWPPDDYYVTFLRGKVHNKHWHGDLPT